MTPTTRLNGLLQRNQNSLDFIRFAAAVAVIFSHAYPYALGSDYQQLDPLWDLSKHNFTTGTLAVGVFFAISGFLVTASLERSGSAISYLKARFLRIYPGLFVLVVLTIFVLGPLFTTLSLGDYFRQMKTYEYFRVLLLYHVLDYSLPGVFATNAYPSLLNGSLWTLFWEVVCYLLTLVLWLTKLLRGFIVLVLGVGIVCLPFIVSAIGADQFNQWNLAWVPDLFASVETSNFFLLAGYFFSGTIFYLFRDHIPMRRRFVVLGIITLILCLAVTPAYLKVWVVTFGTYILFYIASSEHSPFKHFGRYGDFSFGLYIYAPLIHQSIVYLFGGTMQPMLNFALTVPITLIFAVLSWYLVEKPALKLKNTTLRFFSNPTIKET